MRVKTTMLISIVAIAAALLATVTPLAADAAPAAASPVAEPPDSCGPALDTTPCWAMPNCPMSFCGLPPLPANAAVTPGHRYPLRDAALLLPALPVTVAPAEQLSTPARPAGDTAFLVLGPLVLHCRDTLSAEEPPLV